MVDTRDLKSLGQQCPCEFESHPRHLRLRSKCLFSQPQSAIADSPFQGHTGSASLRRATSLLIRFANSLTLRRAADATLRKSPYSIRRSVADNYLNNSQITFYLIRFLRIGDPVYQLEIRALSATSLCKAHRPTASTQKILVKEQFVRRNTPSKKN